MCLCLWKIILDMSSSSYSSSSTLTSRASNPETVRLHHAKRIFPLPQNVTQVFDTVSNTYTGVTSTAGSAVSHVTTTTGNVVNSAKSTAGTTVDGVKVCMCVLTYLASTSLTGRPLNRRQGVYMCVDLLSFDPANWQTTEQASAVADIFFVFFSQLCCIDHAIWLTNA